MATKVDKSSFKIFAVKQRQPMKKVLEKNKIKLEKGKAFYQLTKPETIQDYKKLVVMRNSDNAFITGKTKNKLSLKAV